MSSKRMWRAYARILFPSHPKILYETLVELLSNYYIFLEPHISSVGLPHQLPFHSSPRGGKQFYQQKRIIHKLLFMKSIISHSCDYKCLLASKKKKPNPWLIISTRFSHYPYHNIKSTTTNLYIRTQLDLNCSALLQYSCSHFLRYYALPI